MKIISRNLNLFAFTFFALALVVTAPYAFGQEAVHAEKSKAHKAEYKKDRKSVV